MSACFFESIWKAWPSPGKNIEDNSAALIDSKATFLDITYLLWLVTVTFLCSWVIQQSTYQRSGSRFLLVYQLICLGFMQVSA
jgi:hypothetical protein